jgi:hypothetical protein
MTVHAIVCAVGILTSVGAQNPAAPPQAQSGPAGHWEGAIQIPGQELQIEIDLADRGGGKWEGAINIPSQGLKAYPLSGIAVQGNTVSFLMKGVPGEPHFKGTVSKDAKSISGDFSQGGGTTTFSLAWKGEAKIAAAAKSTAITKDLEGSWEGAIDVNGKSLRLVLKLANQAGAATGTLVSVDQGGAEIPITTITQKGAHLNVAVTAVSGVFDLDMKDGQLGGTWSQGPASFPIVFKRSAK